MTNLKHKSVVETLFLCFLVVYAICQPVLARAEYPEKPLTIIVGMDPGGPTDVSVRAMAGGLERYLATPIMIENKGGGGGGVALGIVAAAKPDGYTVCAGQDVSIVDTALMQKVAFKPLKSFTPVTAFAAGAHSALLVKSDAPWKTFQEFIDYAKKNPGKVKYSTAGVGTAMHVAMEVVAHKDDIKWVHVPYKGAAPAITALLGGHVDACSAAVSWPPHVQSGALRVLATHGEKRSPSFPDVPTLKELGYDYFNWTLHGVVGPAGLPPPVVQKLEAALLRGMETPEFKQALEKLFLTPTHYGSRAYDEHLKEKWVRTERMFKETGIIKEAATQPY
jgi:tripartite-type tricarboxylate transporter receptor subunit TctC